MCELCAKRGPEDRTSARGNGIGMMLTQKIIHTHKGEIAVNSQPSEGTVYTVEIPHI